MKYKASAKEAYDKETKNREFEPGYMVLLHNPCLTGKLESIWEGPYEVMSAISDTTYKLSVPDKRSHTLIVHINSLKPWKLPSVNLFRVVVAQESEGSDESLGKVKMGSSVLSNGQRKQLQQLLNNYGDVVTARLGRVSSTTHSIDTGLVHPIRS